MKQSLHAKPPPNASQIDIELWARDLRWQWFQRAFRSVLGRLVRRVAGALVARRSGAPSLHRRCDESVPVASSDLKRDSAGAPNADSRVHPASRLVAARTTPAAPPGCHAQIQ